MQCTSCGATVPDNVSFCAGCGQPVQQAAIINCASCGRPVKPGLKFCTSCGAPVAVRSPNPYTPQSNVARPLDYTPYAPGSNYEKLQKKKKTNQAIFWLPFGLLSLLGALFFGVANVGIIAWAVLGGVFALMFFLKNRLLSAGVAPTVGSWVAVLILLFLTLGATAPSSPESSSAATTGKGTPAPAGVASTPTQPPAAAATPTKAPSSGQTVSQAVPTVSKPLPTPPSASSPGIIVENMVIGIGLDASQRIVKPASVIEEGVPECNLSLELKNVTKEVTLEVHWLYLPTNEVVKTPPMKATGDGRFGFTLTRPTKGWPPGEFKALVLIDGKELRSIGFSVPKQGAGQAIDYKVQGLASGLGLDQSQKILNPTTQFKSNTPEICFSIETLDVKQETSIDIQLVYIPTGDSLKGPTQKLKPTPGVSRVGFAFSAPTNGWPSGQYKATFYQNSKVAGTIEFSVQPKQ